MWHYADIIYIYYYTIQFIYRILCICIYHYIRWVSIAFASPLSKNERSPPAALAAAACCLLWRFLNLDSTAISNPKPYKAVPQFVSVYPLVI